MKLKSYRSFLCLICIFALLFALSGCKGTPKDVYAESSDFESFPDYYNSFQEDLSSKDDEGEKTENKGTSGEISVPDVELEDGETDIIVNIPSSSSEINSSSSEEESSSSTDSSSTDSSSSEDESSEEVPTTGVDLGNMGPLIPLH